MSAATEHLIEQIEQLERTIVIFEQTGQDSSSLKSELTHLQKKLQVCNEALNQTKRVLKG